MPIRVFYSWQSDQGHNRNFIRSALDAAIRELRKDVTLEEANRDIIVDQDTQGTPGSPGIADVILTKIRSSDVFVADLTFINDPRDRLAADRPRFTPNPNVMLEYGYALHALGDGKIIAVFNEAHGSPKDLPFDLAHRRWPIRFDLSASDDQKKALKETLKSAIRSIIAQFGEQPINSPIAYPFPAGEPGDGVGRLRHPQDFLCLRSGQEKPVWLRPGPYSFFRLIPTEAVKELGDAEAYQIAQSHLQPMGGMRTSNQRTGRHATGAVSYWAVSDNPELAWDASQLYLTRELWANDFYHIIGEERQRAKQYDFSYIPTGALEEVFIDTMINFVGVAARHLALKPPVKIIAGLANAQKRFPKVTNSYLR